MKVDLYDISGKKIKKIEVPEEIFKTEVNPLLMAQAVRVYLANQRQGTQSAKTRGEVSGSGRKIYRQKGTGLARHGDRYAPIFVGGGVAFPPKPRDFSLKIGKKQKRKALFSALTSKMKENAIIFIEGLEKIKRKTKEMLKVLKNLGILDSKKELKILLVLPNKIENLILAARNIKGVTLIPANLLNTYTVLNSDRIIFLKDSIDRLKEVFLKIEREKVNNSEKEKDKEIHPKVSKRKGKNNKEVNTE